VASSTNHQGVQVAGPQALQAIVRLSKERVVRVVVRDPDARARSGVTAVWIPTDIVNDRLAGAVQVVCLARNKETPHLGLEAEASSVVAVESQPQPPLRATAAVCHSSRTCSFSGSAAALVYQRSVGNGALSLGCLARAGGRTPWRGVEEAHAGVVGRSHGGDGLGLGELVGGVVVGDGGGTETQGGNIEAWPPVPAADPAALLAE
jgi:hypothetical protein